MGDTVRTPHHQILGEPQSLATLCWFACYVMLCRWKGWEEKEIKPELKKRLRAGGIDLEEAGRGGLRLKDNLKAAKAIGINAMGYGQPVTAANLRQLIRQSPVWATGQWMPNNNHVYVLVGISDNYVEYYDPWWEGSPEDAYNLKKVGVKWILEGDGNKMRGLAHTHQWYPLQYWKS